MQFYEEILVSSEYEKPKKRIRNDMIELYDWNEIYLSRQRFNDRSFFNLYNFYRNIVLPQVVSEVEYGRPIELEQ